jgi:myosin heavy subunit
MIACNPYRWITGLYSDERRLLYSKTLVWEPAGKISDNKKKKKKKQTTSQPFVAPPLKKQGKNGGEEKAEEEDDEEEEEDPSGGVSSPQDYLEPHVYEQSALAYRGLALDGHHQSILVTGESGAGKTETVKICMNHLASVSSGPPESRSNYANNNHHHHHHQTSKRYSAPHFEKIDASKQQVIQRILDSNPLLEAFGNAKTRRNDNSSRFGKYIQLQFKLSEEPDPGDLTASGIPECALIGSYCDTYLLEKNRVIHHDEDERTFHVFYQLLASPDAVKTTFWKGLKGRGPRSFSYVGATSTTSIEGVPDERKFQSILAALKMVGVEGENLRLLLRGICMVLVLGNIKFEPHHEEGTHHDGCRIGNKTELKDLADLMGIEKEVDDLEWALTHRTVAARNESTKVPLPPGMAKEFCDAFAKHLYSCLFTWLVRTINDATCGSNFQPELKGETVDINDFGIIGLLDIFGFEFFQTNSLEQLCINYANEMLQAKFTRDVFDSVYEEYKAQGLSLDRVYYDDNTDVLNLIQTPRTGLLAILNEECILPQGNDLAFCRKVIQANKPDTTSSLFIGLKFEKHEFGIRHYAAEVVYDTRNFLTKNQDTVPADLVICVAKKSSNAIVTGELAATLLEMQATNGKGRRMSSTIVSKTVWTKYRGQLQDLMENLEKTQSRYIRCIKPNAKKLPLKMEHALTLEQLRSAGVVAAITMAQAAFPNRMENKQVYDRFESLWRRVLSKRMGLQVAGKSKKFSKEESYRENITNMLDAALKPMEVIKGGKLSKAFAVGKTRTYFVAGALEYLEALRFQVLESSALSIQRLARGIVVRKTIMHPALLRKRISGRQRLQSWWRIVRAKRVLGRLRWAARSTLSTLQVQCWWRVILAKKAAWELKRKSLMKGARVVMQSWWRAMLAKKILAGLRHEVYKRKCVLNLQLWVRVCLAKMAAKKLSSLAEKRRRRKAKEAKIQRKKNRAVTVIQARIRGIIQRRRYGADVHLLHLHNELDDEIESMKSELAFLADQLDKSSKSLKGDLKMAEETAKKKIEEQLNSSMNGFRESIIEGDTRVIAKRTENKILRSKVRKMEAEGLRIKANIVTMEKSNEQALDAVTDVRNAYLRLVVRNQKLAATLEGEEDEVEHKTTILSSRVKQYEVEKLNRKKYLETVNRAVKLVKKKMPDTEMAKKVTEIAKKYVMMEAERRQQPTLQSVGREDSVFALNIQKDDESDEKGLF